MWVSLRKRNRSSTDPGAASASRLSSAGADAAAQRPTREGPTREEPADAFASYDSGVARNSLYEAAAREHARAGDPSVPERDAPPSRP
jgi:hypothetical protein